jgi:hypothetical protein
MKILNRKLSKIKTQSWVLATATLMLFGCGNTAKPEEQKESTVIPDSFLISEESSSDKFFTDKTCATTKKLSLENPRIQAAGRARTYTYSIQRGGHMRGISAEETSRRFRQGLNEMEAVSGLKFVEYSSGGNLKITFHHQNNMKYGALGLAYSGGRIWINNSREVGLNNPGSRVAQGLIIHEVMHELGFSHTNTRGCIMHPWGGSYLCQAEKNALARKYGAPYDPNAGKAERERLLALKAAWQVKVTTSQSVINDLNASKTQAQLIYQNILDQIDAVEAEYKLVRKQRPADWKNITKALRSQRSALMKQRNSARNNARSFDRKIKSELRNITKYLREIAKIDKYLN